MRRNSGTNETPEMPDRQGSPIRENRQRVDRVKVLYETGLKLKSYVSVQSEKVIKGAEKPQHLINGWGSIRRHL